MYSEQGWPNIDYRPSATTLKEQGNLAGPFTARFDPKETKGVQKSNTETLPISEVWS
jgi:hypothetical protein